MLLLLRLEVFFAAAAAVVVTAVVAAVAELFVVDSFSLFFATDLQVHERAARKKIFLIVLVKQIELRGNLNYTTTKLTRQCEHSCQSWLR